MAFPCAALAQQALPMTAESLVHEKEGAVLGCGIRVTGGTPDARGPSSWFDLSVNLFRRGIALVQAVAYEMPKSGTGESRPARAPVQSAWITVDGSSAKLAKAPSARIRSSTVLRSTTPSLSSTRRRGVCRSYWG